MRSNGKMSLLTTVVYSCCIVLIAQATSTDYCSPDVCNGHVACDMKPDQFNKYNCNVDAEIIRLTMHDKNNILKHINELRNTVALGNLDGFNGASNMSTIRWDAELAYIAEMNVRSCTLHRDSCRNTRIHKNVGQTTAYGGVKGKIRSSSQFITQHINNWFKQSSLATMKDILKYSGIEDAPPHNFLQLVHENVHKIGCATLKQSRHEWTQNFFTCNYDEAPIKGQPVYHSSNRPGDGCISGKNQRLKGLCAIIDDEDEDDLETREDAEFKTKHPNENANNNRAVTSNEKVNDAIPTTNDDHETENNDEDTPNQNADPNDHREAVNKPDNQTQQAHKRTIVASNNDEMLIDFKNANEIPSDNDVDSENMRFRVLEENKWRFTFRRFLNQIEDVVRKGKYKNVRIRTMNHVVTVGLRK